jgi:outer membrane protein assembly factor BamB
MKILIRIPLLFAGAALLAALQTQASDWSNWRGPHFNGTADAKGMPAEFDKNKNVVWSSSLPGTAAATPIVHGDRIFISSADEDSKTLNAIALDRKTGKILWNRVVGKGELAQDNRSNFASPSPTTDGKRVVFFYGNGELVAFDFAGKELWHRNICAEYGDFNFQWTFSTSPLLHDGKLYIQVLQRNEPVRGRGKENAASYLLAVNPEDGRTLWKHDRPSQAVAESLEAFSTPMPYTHKGREELLIVGGDCVSGHDPKTGKEFWRWGTWNESRIGHWRLVPSPVAGAGVILACAPKQAPVYAVKAGGEGDLSGKADALAWTSADNREITSDVPTPLFYQGDFFVLSDPRRDVSISRLDPKTGRAKWTTVLPNNRKKWRASPTGADGLVYIMDHGANVVVLDAVSGKIVHTVNMGESGDDFTRSSIVACDGQLFIRTNWKLFCISK